MQMPPPAGPTLLDTTLLQVVNGLRGIAVLMVFICHYIHFIGAPWVVPWTWEGVDLFFVLSGFLITGILYDDLADPRFFRNFYIRRALRIFPLFYGFFALLFLCTPILHLHYERTILYYVFYVGNLALPFLNLDVHNPTIITALHHGNVFQVANIGHLWSLCIEEQFYLLWPAILFVVRDRRKLMWICGTLIAATVAGRFYLWNHISTQHLVHYLIFWSTYTRCDTLLIGAWMALWLRGKAITPVRLHRTAAGLIVGPSLTMLIGMRYFSSPLQNFFTPFISTVGFTCIGLISAGVILWCLDETSYLARIVRVRPLSALGVISYGFYFLHSIPEYVWVIFQSEHPHWRIAIPFLAFAFTAGLATLSFRYFESPFLRLKKRFAPQYVQPGPADERLHVSIPRPEGSRA